MTYAEAAELAYNGAKVLHPRTLAPLVEKQIPVWSKNSFAPHKPGSKIVSHFDEPKGARAVTSMSNVAMISMEPANALFERDPLDGQRAGRAGAGERRDPGVHEFQLPAELLFPDQKTGCDAGIGSAGGGTFRLSWRMGI